MPRYKLKLKKLEFISPVDAPAQETASVKLLKRKGKVTGDVDGFARVAKIDEALGLVFCWAFTSKAAGEDYYDLHGDCIDENFVKVAMEFMQGSRATDEMHDSEPDGQVVFAMPLTPDIAKAFDIETDNVGLMVALKPSADVFAKFVSGEYTGVSIAGLGERELVEKGKAVSTKKRSALTTAVLGHAHLIYGLDDAMAGSTSWESTYEEGKSRDYSGHSHAWVRGEDGAIVIGEAMGHAHEVATLSSAIAKKTPTQPALELPDTRSKSTTADAVPTVVAHTEKSKMKTDAEKITDLEKSLADIGKKQTAIRKLSPDAIAYWQSLSDADADAFIAKSESERQPLVESFVKGREVEYTSDDGTVYTKRDDARMVKLAKSADDERKARVTMELTKRASDELGNFVGEVDDKVELLRGISKIADVKRRDGIEKMLKGANEAYAMLGKMQGVNVEKGPTAESAEGKLEALAVKIATEQKVDIGKARDLALDTAEGAALYNEISKARRARTQATA